MTTVDLNQVRARRLADDHAGVIELLGPTRDDEPHDVAYERGRANFELGNWSEAVEALETLPPEYRKAPMIAIALALSCQELGQLHEAFTVAAQVEDDPSFAALATELAIEAGDREEAEAQLEQVRELDSAYPRIPELEQALENIDEELAAVRAAWDEEPWSASALRALCQALFERDMEAHAYELAQIAVEEAEHDPDVWRVFVEFMRKAELSTDDQVEFIRPEALSLIAVGMASVSEELCQMIDAPQMRPVEAYARLRDGREEEARALAEGLDHPLARYVVARAGGDPAALHAMLECEDDPWIVGLVWLALAENYHRAEDYRPALEYAERAVEILSEVPEASPVDIGRAYFTASACHEKLDDIPSMRTAALLGLEEVADLPMDAGLSDKLYILLHNSFYDSSGPEIGEDERMSIDLAQVRARRVAGDYAGMLELLGPAREDEPIDVSVERKRAQFKLNKWSEVVEDLELLPDPYLKLIEVALPIIGSLDFLGRLHEALELAEQLEFVTMESFRDLKGWATELAIEAGDREQADAQLERLRELEPDHPRIAELEQALEDIDEELADARAAWDDEPWSASALRGLCEVLFDRSMAPHALELAYVAVEESEHDHDVWRVFVEFMREAELSIEEQVEIVLPEARWLVPAGMAVTAQALCQMVPAPQMRPIEAYALLRQGRYDQAHVLAEGLDDLLARYVVAMTKARAGEGTAALHAMLESEDDPWIRGLVWLGLAETCYWASDYPRGIEYAERAIEILSEEPNASPAEIGHAHRVAAFGHGRLGDFLSTRAAASLGLEVVSELPPSSDLCEARSPCSPGGSPISTPSCCSPARCCRSRPPPASCRAPRIRPGCGSTMAAAQA